MVDKENKIQPKKPNNRFKAFLTWKNLFWLVLGVLVLLIATGVIFAPKYHKDLVEELTAKEKARNDSLIMVSRRKQDSLLNLLENAVDVRDEYKRRSEQIDLENRWLYDELKRKSNELKKRRVDTSFGNNARIITNGVDRFYQTNDSIR